MLLADAGVDREVANRDLDEILDLIAKSLQLTETQFKKAETSYHAVGDWLQDKGSDISWCEPDIFPQGSLLLDTTVKPLAEAEFDLDLICLLHWPNAKPAEIYDALLERIMKHGRYAPIVSPERRCIRLCYQGDFHLDIVPAIVDPNCKPDQTCILIPGRLKQVFHPSNPKGYAGWFEKQTYARIREEVLNARMSRDPIPQAVPSQFKAPLKLSVQLIKRWRDVFFADHMELAPSSIVLTTLAALMYTHEDHPTEAIMSILDGICSWADSGPIVLWNPSNPDECLTDRWSETPKMYTAFVDAIHDFRDRWRKLIEHARFPGYVQHLKDLFAEQPVANAMTKYAQARNLARDGGSLRTDTRNGSLIITSSTASAAALQSIKNSTHKFFGS